MDMDMDQLTIGEAKQIAAMFEGPQSDGSHWEVGKSYLIRTVTMTLTGRLVAVTQQELVLSDAAWIADTGRYTTAVRTGEFNEVEPYPDGVRVIVGRGALIDAVEFRAPLPREQR